MSFNEITRNLENAGSREQRIRELAENLQRRGLAMTAESARQLATSMVETERKVQQRYLDGRVRKLAWTYPGKELAKLTGLSVTGAYGLRYGTGHITLYTLLGFLAAGHRLDELVFGARL